METMEIKALLLSILSINELKRLATIELILIPTDQIRVGLNVVSKFQCSFKLILCPIMKTGVICMLKSGHCLLRVKTKVMFGNEITL